ncbi:MAG: hypothetical protein WC709_01490 [Thermoleophilia bacterium]
MSGLGRRALLGLCAVALAFAGSALAAGLHAGPAAALSAWQHDSAVGCSCHSGSPPTDATCTACHSGFVSVPDKTCWSCHAPGQDTSSLSSPSAACSQSCHLYDSFDKRYTAEFTHGTSPHLGASAECLACHTTSAGIASPAASPHHNGPQEFDACGVCHGNYQKHAGAVACASCHPRAAAFHTFQASSPGFKRCTGCHTKRHAGRLVPLGKCASCHKGSGPGVQSRAQHSASVTKKRTCNQTGCHAKPLHASRRGSGIKRCARCHTSKFHARQAKPSSSVCVSCHSRAPRHANGFGCVLCHRRAVHQAWPTARRY